MEEIQKFFSLVNSDKLSISIKNALSIVAMFSVTYFSYFSVYTPKYVTMNLGQSDFFNFILKGEILIPLLIFFIVWNLTKFIADIIIGIVQVSTENRIFVLMKLYGLPKLEILKFTLMFKIRRGDRYNKLMTRMSSIIPADEMKESEKLLSERKKECTDDTTLLLRLFLFLISSQLQIDLMDTKTFLIVCVVSLCWITYIFLKVQVIEICAVVQKEIKIYYQLRLTATHASIPTQP